MSDEPFDDASSPADGDADHQRILSYNPTFYHNRYLITVRELVHHTAKPLRSFVAKLDQSMNVVAQRLKPRDEPLLRKRTLQSFVDTNMEKISPMEITNEVVGTSCRSYAELDNLLKLSIQSYAMYFALCNSKQVKFSITVPTYEEFTRRVFVDYIKLVLQSNAHPLYTYILSSSPQYTSIVTLKTTLDHLVRDIITSYVPVIDMMKRDFDTVSLYSPAGDEAHVQQDIEQVAGVTMNEQDKAVFDSLALGNNPPTDGPHANPVEMMRLQLEQESLRQDELLETAAAIEEKHAICEVDNGSHPTAESIINETTRAAADLPSSADASAAVCALAAAPTSDHMSSPPHPAAAHDTVVTGGSPMAVSPATPGAAPIPADVDLTTLVAKAASDDEDDAPSSSSGAPSDTAATCSVMDPLGCKHALRIVKAQHEIRLKPHDGSKKVVLFSDLDNDHMNKILSSIMLTNDTPSELITYNEWKRKQREKRLKHMIEHQQPVELEDEYTSDDAKAVRDILLLNDRPAAPTIAMDTTLYATTLPEAAIKSGSEFQLPPYAVV